MHGSCREIDELVVPTLSGPFLLQLAASIQERFPEVISNMPVLSSHLQVLARAEQAAKFFGKSNLSALCAAIAAEGAR